MNDADIIMKFIYKVTAKLQGNSQVVFQSFFY